MFKMDCAPFKPLCWLEGLVFLEDLGLFEPDLSSPLESLPERTLSSLPSLLSSSSPLLNENLVGSGVGPEARLSLSSFDPCLLLKMEVKLEGSLVGCVGEPVIKGAAVGTLLGV